MSASTDNSLLALLAYLFLLLSILFLAYAIALRVVRKRRRLTHRYSLSNSELVYERIPRTGDSARPLIVALKNPDWEARSAAVIALAFYGDESALNPLVNILFHDSNEAVRKNACSTLKTLGGNKAIDPLLSTVDNYIKGIDTNADVATAAAEALGEIGSPKATKTLRTLQRTLTKNALTGQSKRVSSAVKKITSAMKRKDLKCVVCNLPIKNGEELVRCPSCGNLAHKSHMLEWLHIRGCCPVCGERILESELEEPN
jgi:HEAT repeat protein